MLPLLQLSPQHPREVMTPDGEDRRLREIPLPGFHDAKTCDEANTISPHVDSIS